METETLISLEQSMNRQIDVTTDDPNARKPRKKSVKPAEMMLD